MKSHQRLTLVIISPENRPHRPATLLCCISWRCVHIHEITDSAAEHIGILLLVLRFGWCRDIHISRPHVHCRIEIWVVDVGIPRVLMRTTSVLARSKMI